jgi:hypothetical protein
MPCEESFQLGSLALVVEAAVPSRQYMVLCGDKAHCTCLAPIKLVPRNAFFAPANAVPPKPYISKLQTSGLPTH